MEKIQLGCKTLELYCEKNMAQSPVLLEQWKKGEGYIPSEADWRILCIKFPILRQRYVDTSTLSATKGKDVKVILPYDNSGNHELTEAAELSLNLINQDGRFLYWGVDLDMEDRLEKLDGNGVYTLQRKGLVLNQDLTEEEAMQHPLLLTKLGHPDHVDKEFWMIKEEKQKSIDNIYSLIHNTFELGKNEHGYNTMMGQYLPDESNGGILKQWFVDQLGYGSWSGAKSGLVYGSGRLAFHSVKGACSCKEHNAIK